MENETKYEPPKQRGKGLAFLFAGTGIFMLIGALDVFRVGSNRALGWLLAVAAAAVIVFAARWARKG